MRHVVALASIPIVVIGAALVANVAGVDGPATTIILVVAMIGAIITARAIDLSGPERDGRDRPAVDAPQAAPAVPAQAVASRPPGKRQGLALLAIPTIIVGTTVGGRLAGIDGYGIVVVAVVVAVIVARAIDRPSTE